MLHDDTEQLLKRRSARTGNDKSKLRWEPPPGTWDPSLPYDGKVCVVSRNQSDSAVILGVQFGAIALLVFACIYSYYYVENVAFHIHHAYARFGHTEAQHKIGQSYLQGKGVQQDHKKAMKWFKKAAKNGHPEAAYNLGVGHLKGHTRLKIGDTKKLMQHAARKGIKEAHYVLKQVCAKNKCD